MIDLSLLNLKHLKESLTDLGMDVFYPTECVRSYFH